MPAFPVPILKHASGLLPRCPEDNTGGPKNLLDSLQRSVPPIWLVRACRFMGLGGRTLGVRAGFSPTRCQKTARGFYAKTALLWSGDSCGAAGGLYRRFSYCGRGLTSAEGRAKEKPAVPQTPGKTFREHSPQSLASILL